MRERREDVERLLRLVDLLLLRQRLQRAHVVEAVGQLDQDHPDVGGHRDHHLPVVLGLLLVAAVEGDPRQLGDAVDELGDVVAEALAHVVERRGRVLDRVVQEAGADRLRVEAHARADLRHADRVGDELLARAAALVRVALAGERECVPDQLEVHGPDGVVGVLRHDREEIREQLLLVRQEVGADPLRARGGGHSGGGRLAQADPDVRAGRQRAGCSVRVQDRLARAGRRAVVVRSAGRGRYAALAFGVSRVSVSRNRCPSSAARAHARKACERSRSARPPFVVVHLRVPLERSRFARDSSSRTRRQRPATTGLRGYLPSPASSARVTSAPPLPKGGQRTVDRLQVRPQRMLVVPAPARANSTSAGPKPRCRKRASLAGAAAQRSRGLGQRRWVEREHVREAAQQGPGPGRVRRTRTAPAQRRRACPLEGIPAAPRRQAHPWLAAEALRPQVTLDQRCTARHVRTQDEQRLAGRHEVAEHAHGSLTAAIDNGALGALRAHRGPRLRGLVGGPDGVPPSGVVLGARPGSRIMRRASAASGSRAAAPRRRATRWPPVARSGHAGPARHAGPGPSRRRCRSRPHASERRPT